MPGSLPKNSLGKNTVWALVGEILSRLIAFGAVVWLANYLGSEQWGSLNYAFALANLLVIVADFGLSTYLVKELAPRLDTVSDRLPSILGLKVVLMSLSFGTMIVLGLVLPNVSWQLMAVGGLAIIMTNARTLVEAIFRAWQRLEKEALTKNVSAILLVVGLGAAIIASTDIMGVAFAYAGATGVSLVFAWFVMRKSISTVKFKFAAHAWKNILTASWPFALAIAFNYLFNYMDTAMLGLFNQQQAVGWYSAAYKIIFFLTALAGVIVNAFFPIITTEHQAHPEKAEHTIQLLFRLLLLCALPLAIGGTLLGPDIIDLFYTAEYAPAGLAFQILIWSTALIYVWAAFGNSLQAIGKEKVYTRGFAWGALINVILNIALIPTYSLYGAAFATVLTQLFLLFYMYRQLRRIMPLYIWTYAWRPVLACVIMGGSLYMLQLPLGWSIGLGVAIYVPLLYAFRGIGESEINFLKSIWHR